MSGLNHSNPLYQNETDYSKIQNKFNLTTEQLLKSKDYLLQMNNFFKSGNDGYFNGKNGIQIYFKYFLKDKQNERGIIVITVGRSEPLLKYKELIFDFYNNGYSVYIHDHRGQGFSQRIYGKDTQMGHIDNFDYYVDDLKKYYEDFIKTQDNSKVYLLGHSMGCSIAARYIEKYPNDFIAAAFSSPMFGFRYHICKVLQLFSGNKPGYFIGNKNYDSENKNYSNNKLTHSIIRYEMMNNMFEENPSAKIGGVSYQWVYQACSFINKVLRDMDKIKIPVLIIQASREKIVSINSQRKFYLKMKGHGKDITNYIAPEAYHELLIEEDIYRIPVITTILDFFNFKNSVN